MSFSVPITPLSPRIESSGSSRSKDDAYNLALRLIEFLKTIYEQPKFYQDRLYYMSHEDDPSLPCQPPRRQTVPKQKVKKQLLLHLASTKIPSRKQFDDAWYFIEILLS